MKVSVVEIECPQCGHSAATTSEVKAHIRKAHPQIPSGYLYGKVCYYIKETPKKASQA